MSKIDTVLNNIQLILQSLSALGGYFVQLLVLWGLNSVHCLEIGGCPSLGG